MFLISECGRKRISAWKGMTGCYRRNLLPTPESSALSVTSAAAGPWVGIWALGLVQCLLCRLRCCSGARSPAPSTPHNLFSPHPQPLPFSISCLAGQTFLCCFLCISFVAFCSLQDAAPRAVFHATSDISPALSNTGILQLCVPSHCPLMHHQLMDYHSSQVHRASDSNEL